jgi:hypothetical protein
VTPAPYRMSSRPDGNGLCYEGPFGALTAEWTSEGAVTGKRGIILTGDHVERALLAWTAIPEYEKRGFFSLDAQAEAGVTMTIDGVTVRAHKPRLGVTRLGRQMYMERPGEHRLLRLRRFRTLSLEKESGARLVTIPGMRLTGTVHEPADLLDVVVLTFLSISGLKQLVTPGPWV